LGNTEGQKNAAPVGAAGGLGLEELAAIRRTLAEVDDP
jgi:hypothetical protein